MRTAIAAFLAVSITTTVFATPVAQASPILVNVRIEGRTKTLFEGPILTQPHKVKAASDSQWRLCNGINVNDPWNVSPAPVPTSVSSDAMRIVGETFNGQWYNQYEDYFVTRWGPDAQNLAASEDWGIVVNNVFTSVGGCQYQLDAGDEVLWVYDAFGGRPRLGLYPVGYAGAAAPLTATATLGLPFEVEVGARSGYNEGVPPASPQRTGSTPFQGAEVAPVETSGKWFERVETESAETVTTGADGKTSVTFTTPGWHRIKATAVDSGGKESAVRSNRLDVCVPTPPATACGALPVDDQVRMPPASAPGEEEPQPDEPKQSPSAGGSGQAGAGGQALAGGVLPAAEAGQVRLRRPRVDRSRVAHGRVGVSWRVLDAGVGIEKWTVSSMALGRKGARYVTRASGESGTSATLRLPPGATYRLRLIVIDVLDRNSTIAVGNVQVPT